MNKQNKEIRDLIEKETPKNIVVSFVLAMLFGVAAGLAAIAYGEVILNFALRIIYSSELAAAQYVGFKRISQITSLTTMLMGWVIAFMIVWHKIEKKQSMHSAMLSPRTVLTFFSSISASILNTPSPFSPAITAIRQKSSESVRKSM